MPRDGIPGSPQRPAGQSAGLVVAFDADALDELADALADRLVARLQGGDEDRWMETAEAAHYIGRSPAALHKLTAARAIPFSQDGPRAKCYFRRSALDRWMGDQAQSGRYAR